MQQRLAIMNRYLSSEQNNDKIIYKKALHNQNQTNAVTDKFYLLRQRNKKWLQLRNGKEVRIMVLYRQQDIRVRWDGIISYKGSSQRDLHTIW